MRRAYNKNGGAFDADYYDDGPFNYCYMPYSELCYGDKEKRSTGWRQESDRLWNGRRFYAFTPESSSCFEDDLFYKEWLRSQGLLLRDE